MSFSHRPRVVIFGANGDPGHRIAHVLAKKNVEVVAVVRPHIAMNKKAHLLKEGVNVVNIDLHDAKTMSATCEGATCVISALNGLESVILDLQSLVLQAAMAAKVPRFIPSDYSLDFTKTRPGENRNMDLRRSFMNRINAAPIRATSVLNGAFADLLTGQAPIVLHKWRRILHWGSPTQAMDFTAKQDVAEFTADVALDDAAPRFSRIAGDVVSPQDLANIMSTLTGHTFKLFRAGGISMLSGMIKLARTLTPATEAPFPAWQGMQYLRDMQSGRGKLDNLDNGRYGARKWVSAKDLLMQHQDSFVKL